MSTSDVWEERTFKARKDHFCISGCRIKKGETYMRISSLYDGHWSAWKVHPAFQAWLDVQNKGLMDDRSLHYHDYLEADLDYMQLVQLRAMLNDTNGDQLTKERISHRMERISWGRLEHLLRTEISKLKAQGHNMRLAG